MREQKQNYHSELALTKFNTTAQKSRDLSQRMQASIEDHRLKNEERFITRDEGLKKAKEDREDFIRREDKRHKKKIMARERILRNISIEQAQKQELRLLQVKDAENNLERQRMLKQEKQDFLLKKETIKNAFNQEASMTASFMINS